MALPSSRPSSDDRCVAILALWSAPSELAEQSLCARGSQPLFIAEAAPDVNDEYLCTSVVYAPMGSSD